MHSTTYTSNTASLIQAPARRVVYKVMTLRTKIILMALVGNIILSFGIYSAIYNSNPERYAYGSIVDVGSQTKSLMKQLNSLSPVAIATISRNAMSVDGKLLSIKGDNIQVFEYDSSKDTQKESLALAEKYASKESVHVYIKDKLAIFYMGNDEDIMKAITGNSYQSTTGLSKNVFADVSVVSKKGDYYK